MDERMLNEEYLTRMKASIVDSSNNFIGIADLKGRLIYLNNAAYAKMGYGPEERPEFTSIADIHANDFHHFALNVIQPMVFEKGFWNGTGYLRHKNGSVITVAQSVFPVCDEKGVIYGIAAVIRDIAEIPAINKRVKKDSELFQKVLDSARIGIVLINMKTHIVEMVNCFMQEMLQMRAEEIIGQRCCDVLCRSSMDLCPHVNERELTTIVTERVIERKDGSLIPVIKTGTRITIEDKEYLVDSFVDISLQKDLEKNLLEAKIAAEAANRGKSEFLSRMSHEMRTPLNAIVGMARIAGCTDSREKLQEAIKTIEVSSLHLLDLINDVLDLSKIEEGRLDLSIEPFSLAAMVEKINSLIREKTREKDIRFVIRADEDIPQTLVGDSMRLSQVLLNFLSNAVKFTPEKGGVELKVSLQGVENNKARLLFSVRDNGMGISRDQLERLFHPFVQADGSISRRFGGTGLGLAINKRILALMNSDISVETEEGQGSCFSFGLDLPVAAASPAGGTRPEELGEIKNIYAGKRGLVVDDVALNRIVTLELLAETGMVIDEAANGREAIDMVAENAYDIIFMDVQMPIMDGYEATKQIRAMEGPAKDTVIMAVSANVFKEDVESSLKAGMNAHIAKPLNIKTLISTINCFLDNPKNYDASEDEQVSEAVD
ncbi:MAG: ATP-binding protein [Dehalobacter sp.]|nr:ATP-binding protein [Dehalobacter sp.]